MFLIIVMNIHSSISPISFTHYIFAKLMVIKHTKA